MVCTCYICQCIPKPACALCVGTPILQTQRSVVLLAAFSGMSEGITRYGRKIIDRIGKKT